MPYNLNAEVQKAEHEAKAMRDKERQEAATRLGEILHAVEELVSEGTKLARDNDLEFRLNDIELYTQDDMDDAEENWNGSNC